MNNFLPTDDCITMILDGVPAFYWRLGLAERPHIPTPERQGVVTEIMGRLGQYREHFSFNDMDIEVKMNYLEDVVDFNSFKTQFYTIRKWLLEGKRLSFSDEPHIYYLVKAVAIGDALNDMVEYGEFDVKLTVAPFGRVYEDSPIQMKNSPTTDTPFLVETLENSYPLIEFRPTSSTPEFRINDTLIRFVDLSVTKTYYLDSELKVFYYVDDATGSYVEEALKMRSLMFPTLNDGVNLWYSKDMEKIKIYRNMLR